MAIALDDVPVATAVVSRDGRFLEANRALCSLLCRDRSELLGCRDVELIAYDADGGMDALRDALLGPGTDCVRRDVRCECPDGRQSWVELTMAAKDEHSLVYAFVGIDDRKRLEQELTARAFHDALTDLPNRRLLLDRLNQTLLARHRKGTGLLFVDLDRFKEINDLLGHEIGDHVLRCTAQRLQAATRPEDTVSRVGGDEFVVLCEGVSEDQLESLRQRLDSRLAERIPFEELRIASSASIGTAFAPAEASLTAEQLLARVDADMYRRKRERAEAQT